jgi:hypothetical protein
VELPPTYEEPASPEREINGGAGVEEGDDGGELFDDSGVDLNGVQEFIFQLEAERREEREELHRQLAEQYTELETLRARLPPDRRELSRQPSAPSAQVSSPTSPPHCLAQDPATLRPRVRQAPLQAVGRVLGAPAPWLGGGEALPVAAVVPVDGGGPVGWSCSVCTLLNQPGADACAACDEPSPAALVAAAGPAPGAMEYAQAVYPLPEPPQGGGSLPPAYSEGLFDVPPPPAPGGSGVAVALTAHRKIADYTVYRLRCRDVAGVAWETEQRYSEFEKVHRGAQTKYFLYGAPKNHDHYGLSIFCMDKS